MTLNGTIGGRYRIKGTIDFGDGPMYSTGHSFTGTYGYSGRTTGMYVEGEINGVGQFSATEYDDNGNTCGTYQGTADLPTITGQFVNSRGEQYSFVWKLNQST